jgi:hypothetical protein
MHICFRQRRVHHLARKFNIRVNTDIYTCQNQRGSCRAVAMCVLLACLIGCEVERAADGITCDKLRSLKIGMSIDEVRTLMGSPLQEVRQDGNTNFGGPKGADTAWSWSHNSNAVRLFLYFGQRRLLGGDSWIRTMWRDLFDDDGRPVLFRLSEDGVMQEGDEFQRVYCPASLK